MRGETKVASCLSEAARKGSRLDTEIEMGVCRSKSRDYNAAFPSSGDED